MLTHQAFSSIFAQIPGGLKGQPMPSRQIYLLSPKELSPETIAVAFAKTSRSPESFRQIAAELSDESSARFHEKWVVGYGHAWQEGTLLRLALSAERTIERESPQVYYRMLPE